MSDLCLTSQGLGGILLPFSTERKDTRDQQPIQHPVVTPQTQLSICQCLRVLVTTVSFLCKSGRNAHFRRSLNAPVSFCCYFSVSVALHFLLSFSGDLKTDPGDAAACVTNAPWANRMVCLGKCDFFSPFSFSQINAEKVVQGLGF